jgi:hypothetical protein
VNAEHDSEEAGSEPVRPAEPEDPTAVDGPLSEDETSPEGIPADEETTGLEEALEPPGVASPEEPKPAPPRAPPHEPPPQVRLVHKPPAPIEWRIARIVAAFALAGGAFGVHMWLNVPDEPVVASPRDQGSKNRNKHRARNARSERMPERSEAELEEAWSRWGELPFDEEPMRGRWSRDMQTMVNKAVVVARKAAFEGAPEDPRVIVTGTQCRTIRCQFVLRSPYEHEVDLLVKALQRVTYDGDPMWRTVEAESIDPPSPQSPKDDHYRQVVVRVRVDGYEPGAIDIADPDAHEEAKD